MFKTLNSTNKTKFNIQITITLLMFAVWALLLAMQIEPTKLSDNQCFFYHEWGIFCPGCGGTRAFEYMLHFHFLKSFFYHPFVVTTVFILLFSDLSYILYFITRGKILFYELKIKHFIFLDLVFIANFLIKNLFVWYFGYYIF